MLQGQQEQEVANGTRTIDFVYDTVGAISLDTV